MNQTRPHCVIKWKRHILNPWRHGTSGKWHGRGMGTSCYVCFGLKREEWLVLSVHRNHPKRGKFCEKGIQSFLKSQQVASAVTIRLEKVVRVFKRNFIGSSYESENTESSFGISKQRFAFCGCRT